MIDDIRSELWKILNEEVSKRDAFPLFYPLLLSRSRTKPCLSLDIPSTGQSIIDLLRTQLRFKTEEAADARDRCACRILPFLLPLTRANTDSYRSRISNLEYQSLLSTASENFRAAQLQRMGDQLGERSERIFASITELRTAEEENAITASTLKSAQNQLEERTLELDNVDEQLSNMEYTDSHLCRLVGLRILG